MLEAHHLGLSVIGEGGGKVTVKQLLFSFCTIVLTRDHHNDQVYDVGVQGRPGVIRNVRL